MKTVLENFEIKQENESLADKGSEAEDENDMDCRDALNENSSDVETRIH